MDEVKHDYPIHTFFWYFKSQKSPENSPLAIWLNGGPGASSMFGLFTENGPCQVTKSSTSPNPWSWNQEYNVLYIDQPVQTGFSYDIMTNSFLDLKSGNIILQQPSKTLPTDRTLIPGTFSSQNIKSTANTTENAARHFWNFVQVWTQDFKEYSTNNKTLSIWTESYGGRYGPSFAAYIQQQNSRIQKGSLSNAKVLLLTTLGIINGCVDLLTQISSRPEYAYDRNEYNITGLTRPEYANALIAYSQKDGCEDKVLKCQYLGETLDPGMYGNVTEVNNACEDANDFCTNEVEGPYNFRKQWAYYNIAHCYLDPFPSNDYLEYLASKPVLDALGVPLNYTDSSNVIGKAFNLTGDYARRDPRGYLQDIGSLLDSGIQVAMIYGDLDYACNWIGGERASLNINYTEAAKFYRAGYANVTIGTVDSVAQVRQHGLFSFTRVYQSGHMVPAYTPEAAYRIFQRVMQKRDVATGKIAVTDDYSTNGPFRSTTTLKAPPMPSATCYLRVLPSTCAENQIIAVENGTAIIKDGIITDPPPTPGTCPKLPGSEMDEMPSIVETTGSFLDSGAQQVL